MREKINELLGKYSNSTLVVVQEYTNSKSPILIYDGRCGHTYSLRYGTIINKGWSGRCKLCNPDKGGGRFSSTEKFLTKIPSNIQLLEEYTRSSAKIKYKYKDCGHTHSMIASDIIRGHADICRQCTPPPIGRSLTTEEFYKKYLASTPNIELVSEYTGSKSPIVVRYKDCQHIHTTVPNALQQGYCVKCPKCSPYSGVSAMEEELRSFILEIYSGWVEFSDRSILEGKELDIVLPDSGIAIEFNGCYFHSTDKNPDIGYHLDKTNKVEEFGYRLIHIMEDEWIQKNEIVKSRLRSIIDTATLNTRIYARKCKVKEVPYALSQQFLSSNHIQGAGTPSKVNLGLYFEETLVALMTFSTPRFNKEYEYELVRFASKLEYQVIGGASKLLKYFIDKYTPKSIISYADRRWSVGQLYKTIGFTYIRSTSPGYAYYNQNKERLGRVSCQKHKLIAKWPEYAGSDLTEEDIMRKKHYHKVYDCGNLVFVWTPK